MTDKKHFDLDNIPPEIETWIDGKNLSAGTRNTYIFDIKTFCEFIRKSPKQIIEEYTEEMLSGVHMPLRKIFSDIPRYNKFMKVEKEYAGKTFAKKSAALKSFLEFYYIQTPHSLTVKAVEPLPENNNKWLDREEIKKMLEFSRNLRNKGIILTQSTSGMGSQEIRTLKVKNIIFREQGHGNIKHKRYKSDHNFYTFISTETVDVIKEYWKHRERVRGKTLTDDDYAFVTVDNDADKERPISQRRFAKIFRKIGEDMGYTTSSSKEFIKTRSHAVRKYFSNTLINAGLQESDVHWMMGHRPNALARAYWGLKEERLEKIYLEYLPLLTFFDEIHIEMPDTERLTALETELFETKDVVNKLTEMFTNQIDAIAENRETYKNEIEDCLMEELLRDGNLQEDHRDIVIDDKTDLKEIQKMVEMLKNKQGLTV
jgi:integrase